MISDADKDSIEKGFLKIQIIWGAIVACLVVYLIIALAFGEEISKGSNDQLPVSLLRNILICVSVFEIFIIRIFRRIMVGKGTILKSTERGTAKEQPPYMAQYMIAVIVSASIAESIGIFGLVLVFLGAGINTFYFFTAASAIVMIYYRPKKEELVEFASKVIQG